MIIIFKVCDNQKRGKVASNDNQVKITIAFVKK